MKTSNIRDAPQIVLIRFAVVAGFMWLCVVPVGGAQSQNVASQSLLAAEQNIGNQSAPATSLAAQANTIVPQLIKFSGTLLDAESRPIATGPVGVTFALYAEQNGGASLWLETQNVRPDENGYYTVLLGSETSTGVPMELFATGEARWLGIQIERQPEQPRVLLVSVPYALKAGDAQTLGGRPASDFALANASSVSSAPTTAKSAAPSATAAAMNAVQNPATSITGTGVADFIPLWTSSTALGDSVLFQSTTKKIGIGNTAPAATLDVTGTGIFRGFLQLPATGTANSTTKGFPSQPFDFLASAYNGTAAVSEHFRWQAEPVNPGLSTASGKLNLLFASGTDTPAETGLSISNKGVITFATGQTLPKVSGNEAVTGNLSATGSVSGATGTFTGNVSTGNQTVTGNVTATGSLAAGTGVFSGSNTTQIVSVTQSGTGVGVAVTSQSGPAIEGVNNKGGSFFPIGVWGISSAPNGIGVEGLASTTATTGVYGEADSTSGIAVQGNSTATSGNTVGVLGQSNSLAGVGVEGVNFASGNGATAISAIETDNNNFDLTFGVKANTVGNFGVGVKGTHGPSSAIGFGSVAIGVWGDGVGGAGVFGSSDDGSGVSAVNNSDTNAAIAASNNSSTVGAQALEAAGKFGNCSIDVSGNLNCTGTITGSSKNFKIDHPADPGNKYLVHASVESSEMMNIYTGNVVLNTNGAATVQLPSWFQAENADFRYQLTTIGSFAPVFVAQEIQNNQFEIAGGKAGQKISWQVTGVRQDAYSKANPLVVEQEKTGAAKGHYLAPELFGQSASQGLSNTQRPDLTKRQKAQQGKADQQ